MTERLKIVKVVIMVVLAFLASCSPKLSKNVLTFFFDGVPQADSIRSGSTYDLTITDENSEVFRSDPVVAGTGLVVHYPYREQNCISCHDEKSKSELILPQPGLCYSCHNDYSKEFKYLHGPVAGGYCTSCHNPHMSENEKLLIRTGQKLCFDCHESKSVFKNESHKEIADSECTLCHNPHGGENRFILN